MHIIVIGCGKVGSSLAAELIRLEHDVVIIDSDPELIQAADNLDCIKITGVPIDRDVLRQAGIETADFVCAVTQNDNINIMTAQTAKVIFNVPKVITRVFNPANQSVFNELGLDNICSTHLTVQAFLRAIQQESYESRHILYGARMLYTRTTIDPKLAGENLNDLTTDQGKLIVGIFRHNRMLLATPELKTQVGDQIILAEIE